VVSRHTDECNVIFDVVARQARVVFDTPKGRDSTEDRIGLDGSAGRSKLAATAPVTHLCSAISRYGVVPQFVKGTFNWGLIMVMVAMSSDSCCKA
jgi:hypothetical protein